MPILVIGILLWSAAHLFKRGFPQRRKAMQTGMGNGAKGIFAAAILLSVVLMVLGYRMAAFVPVYTPPAWGVHVNNLAMLLAVALFGLGSSKSPLRARLRHPMLLGFIIWTLAHLLVNGDLASLVLFGGLLIWAAVEIPVINANEPAPAPFTGGTTMGTVRLVIITVVVYAVIAAIHTWLGVYPFGA